MSQSAQNGRVYGQTKKVTIFKIRYAEAHLVQKQIADIEIV